MFPKRPNYEYCGDYLVSKEFTKKIDVKDFETGDNVNRNVEIDRHLAQQKLMKTEKLLKQARKTALKKREFLDKQWADLAQKEEAFRETFKLFDTFVRENQNKRDRAHSKIKEMTTLLETRVKMVDDIQREMRDSNELKDLIDKNIASQKIYEDYLAKVVDTYPDQFTSILNILKRYESLLHARRELTKIHETYMTRLEQAKADVTKLTADQYVKVSAMNNKLIDLEKRYETAVTNCRKWESIHQNITVVAMEKLMETVAIKGSAWRIYSDICSRHRIKPIFKNDSAKQFEFIKTMLLQYRQVNEAVSVLEEEKLRLSEMACASSSN